MTTTLADLLHPMREELQDEREPAIAQPRSEPLAALFQPEQAEQFRTRWDQVQIGFVDDPRQAVQQADELVAQVMRDMAETFASQRAAIDVTCCRVTAHRNNASHSTNSPAESNGAGNQRLNAGTTTPAAPAAAARRVRT